METMANALKLSAITGYSSFSKRTLFVKDYLLQISLSFSKLLTNFQSSNDLETEVYFNNKSNSVKKLIILVGSTREIGSGYSSALKKHIPKVLSLSTKMQTDFILIGKSGQRALEKIIMENDFIKIIDEYKSFSFKEAEIIAEKISTFILKNKQEYNNVSIINIRFQSLFVNKKNHKTIFPVNPSDINELISPSNKDSNIIRPDEELSFEQDSEILAQTLCKKLIKTSILYEMLESLTAENAARYIAMDKASTNSDRCITELSLKMNKARQILITKQITEIASYADMV